MKAQRESTTPTEPTLPSKTEWRAQREPKTLRNVNSPSPALTTNDDHQSMAQQHDANMGKGKDTVVLILNT